MKDTTAGYRKIIHIDMDAFYASVEQRDSPEYRGKAVAVGGSVERGVVAAASYEARKFGVKSAMPSRTAKKLCPHLIFIKPRFDAYKEASNRIRNIFFEYTDLVEPLSLDEAFLDVTHNKKSMPSATLIAGEIRKKIREETGLTASAGISINKFIAKVASDINKPDGLKLIPPDQVMTFLEELPIEKFFGIGKVTAQKMKNHGIFKGADLKKLERHELVRLFGKSGRRYYKIVRAEDNRPVKPERIRKSIGAENTFFEDLEKEEEMINKLIPIVQKVAGRMKKQEAKGRTITLKIKYHDFVINTRSKSLDEYTNSYLRITEVVQELLRQPFPVKPVRLLGVTLSNLNTIEKKKGNAYQLTLKF